MSTSLDRFISFPFSLPALIEIPLNVLGLYGLIKLELDFGPVLHNFSIDLGKRNKTTKNFNAVFFFTFSFLIRSVGKRKRENPPTFEHFQSTSDVRISKRKCSTENRCFSTIGDFNRTGRETSNFSLKRLDSNRKFDPFVAKTNHRIERNKSLIQRRRNEEKFKFYSNRIESRSRRKTVGNRSLFGEFNFH